MHHIPRRPYFGRSNLRADHKLAVRRLYVNNVVKLLGLVGRQIGKMAQALAGSKDHLLTISQTPNQ